MFNFFKKKEIKKEIKKEPKQGYFSTDTNGRKSRRQVVREAVSNTFQLAVDKHTSKDVAMDSIESIKATMNYNLGGIPDMQLSWYGTQGFIGYQACAMIAQHWLVEKACSIPAKDAIRKGYKVTVNDGTEVEPDVLDEIRKKDKEFRLNQNLVEFVKMGRVFGIRVAMFKVISTDPEYYTKPFNIDGVTAGSYKGISQIDPYWIAPELSGEAVTDPSAINFYEPTYWLINGERVHRSHLIIMRGSEVPDILKPSYLYGGISVPQKIYERVYAAERTANESPMLAMTKRLGILKIDIASAMGNQEKFEAKLSESAYYRDNYQTRVIDKDTEDYVQVDTTLSDLDATIMTQYQLVASVANVPATKLLGTSPKGFNASGEYEEANYREELESIQSFDLAPLIDRHHLLLVKSYIAPKFKINPFSTEVVFNPLDSLTEVEQTDVNLKKAQTAQAYQQTGAIDGHDIREGLIADPKSGYNGMELDEEIETLHDDTVNQEA